MNFYCHFIHNYSNIVTSLTWLTCKDTPWKFTDNCHSAFNLLKKAFTSTPILTHWVPNAPLVVETNISDYALAGILSIISTNSEL